MGLGRKHHGLLPCAQHLEVCMGYTALSSLFMAQSCGMYVSCTCGHGAMARAPHMENVPRSL